MPPPNQGAEWGEYVDGVPHPQPTKGSGERLEHLAGAHFAVF